MTSIKITKKVMMAAVALAMMLGLSITASAERLVTDNFEYNATTLYGQGGWLQYGTQTGDSVFLVNNPLTFAGYQNEAVGKAVKIGNGASGRDVMIPFLDAPTTTGSFYVSALVNVQSVTADNVYFLTFMAPGTSGVVDQRTGSEIGRLYATEGSSEGKFIFKISRNSSSQFEKTGELELGKTYHVVLMYQFVDGLKNDIIKLWVNPSNLEEEPDATAAITDMTAHTSADAARMQAIELRQGSSSTFTGPEVLVDALHVADNWYDLFDHAESTDPVLEVESSMVFTDDAAPINKTTTFATFTVNYKNVPTATQVYLTGANRTQFELSDEEIPAGNGTKVITVYYKPTAIGKHTGRINFESSVTDLNCGYNFTALAYDPDNMPTITVNATDLTEFKCKEGESVQQTFTVTTANLPDYGKAAVEGTANGAFIINNTMLLKNGTAQFTITFKPKTSGNYRETITFTGVKAETKTLELTGTALYDGEPSADAEGDRLPLSTVTPYKYLEETFDGAVKNKVLQVNEWRNLAMSGTRAWWGYEWTDTINKAAKVTAYDSKVESGESTPCQMMLVTPPLDYKNATSQVFSFKLMGDFMLSGMSDTFEVCYIENDENGLYIEPIQMDIPATADYNKEWQSYDLHLENQNIADVFYIGFRFTSYRGSDNTAVYYVDDVKWGEPASAITGDVNGDNLVDIDDVNALINIILGEEQASKYAGADVNGDGNVDIDDVNAVINIILGQ